jgi:hypothetical protein
MKSGQINVNSQDLESAISLIGNSKNALESDAISSLDNDFKVLTELGLFTSGLSSIKSNISKIAEIEGSFISSLSTHLSSLKTQEDNISNYIGSYGGSYGGGGTRSSTATSTYTNADTDAVDKGTKISNTELANFLAEMNVDTSKLLLENISKQAAANGTTITELMLNPEKSGLLVEILKKLCGDTNTEIDTTSTDDSNLIQKILLAKFSGLDTDVFAELDDKTLLKGLKYFTEYAKENGITVTDLLYDNKNSGKLTEAISKLYNGEELDNYKPTDKEVNDVKSYVDSVAAKNNTTSDKLLSSSSNKSKIIETTETKVIKQSAKKEETKDNKTSSSSTSSSSGTTTTTTSGGDNTSADISNLPAVGEHTSNWDTLGDAWVVCTTAASVPSYSSYVRGNICQNADASKFGDKCLSFAETYAYALYTGNTGDSAERASNYPHSGAFESWFSDSKEETLSKVYSEIVAGKPVVIQVNGNKQGTSRHFVTVVGFKNSVKDAKKLTEDDLLIVDSWDGQTERMDQANSRFLTTGAACKKKYSGYYLRILK